MVEKLIRVIDDDFKELNSYLGIGYKIKQISACMTDSNIHHSICYVVLEKE